MFRISELESTFIELIDSKKSDIFNGIIYGHPAIWDTIAAPILDHLLQFHTAPNLFANFSSNSNTFERNRLNFD